MDPRFRRASAAARSSSSTARAARCKEYADTPLAPLFPVEWKGAGVRDGITKLALTERAPRSPPSRSLPDRAQNAELWSTLLPPHWLSGATPLPGAEMLVEAEVAGQKSARGRVIGPSARARCFITPSTIRGAGATKSPTCITSEYWNQIANWIAELPFAVRDKFVSLDAGCDHLSARRIRRPPRAPARRRRQARSRTPRRCRALPRRCESRDASASRADDNAGGLFRGKTAALEPGDYEVGIESAAIPERDSRRARASKSSRARPAS